MRDARSMQFTVGNESLTVTPQAVIVAGFTGRDSAAVAAHIAELEAEGIECPTVVPTFYQVPRECAVQVEEISTLDLNSSGEAELALVVHDGRRYITLASDHTDRAVEAIDIALSKRVCPKVFATEMWPIEEVEDHVDLLQLKSWATEGAGESVLYQSGAAASLLPPLEILGKLDVDEQRGSFVMLCGTVDAIGGVRHADTFSAVLEDPQLGREISLAYDVAVLSPLRPIGPGR